MRLALGVAVLGGLGSLFRWLLSAAIQKQVGPAFPAGTFVVNALGSVAIGVVMGFFMVRGGTIGATSGVASGVSSGVSPGLSPGLSSGVAVALTAGFMGGFTTYSSFAFETLLLIERRAFATVALNVIGTWVVCLIGCAVGLSVGRVAGR